MGSVSLCKSANKPNARGCGPARAIANPLLGLLALSGCLMGESSLPEGGVEGGKGGRGESLASVGDEDGARCWPSEPINDGRKRQPGCPVPRTMLGLLSLVQPTQLM